MPWSSKHEISSSRLDPSVVFSRLVAEQVSTRKLLLRFDKSEEFGEALVFNT